MMLQHLTTANCQHITHNKNAASSLPPVHMCSADQHMLVASNCCDAPKQQLLFSLACQINLASLYTDPLLCRSLAACEQLSRAGYGDIAWINGGFDAARKEDLPVVGAPDLRYGGIGGLSEFLGWTDAQRQNSQTEGFIGGFQNVLKLVRAMLHLVCHVLYCVCTIVNMCAELLQTDCQSRHVCSEASTRSRHIPFWDMEPCARCYHGRNWAVWFLCADVLCVWCRRHLFFSWMACGLATINCSST